jgi:nitrite reductase/ring-hydroxylating ferredoxin subunit
VTSINGGQPCTVEAKSTYVVTANAVCVCTNSPISDMMVTHTKQAAYRSFVVAAAIPKGAAAAALYWDTLDPYHYVRIQSLDNTSDALLVGGEDHKTAHEDDAGDRWRQLESWMRDRWPQAGEILYRWSGQVLEPNDFIGFIGPNPDGAENVYIATGDSGQGMTHGTIAGMLLTDLINGRVNVWESLYDPKRVSLRARPMEEFARENADVALQYVKNFVSGGDASSEADIPVGEGRVIRRGLHKVAAYRDENGTVHSCSALCTHLTCVVQWSTGEKSWDCPCHGSRFDPYGEVLNGLAMTDLDRMSS